jgi:hypothetical protein
LPKYGANAKPALTKLKADPRFGGMERGRFGGAWKAMVKAIETSNEAPQLMSFEEAKNHGTNKRE